MRPYQYDGNPEDAQGSGVPFNGYTILLVDDDALVSSVAEATLRSQGYQVLTAQNSDEALRVSESHTGVIHLLIADQIMPPYMNGPELATCLRMLRPDLQVLYISGFGATATVQDEVGDAYASFLAKPFTPELLVAKVQSQVADIMPSETPAPEEPPRQGAKEGAAPVRPFAGGPPGPIA